MKERKHYDLESLKNVFADAPCGAAVITVNSEEALFFNPAYYSVTGYTPEEYREKIGDDYRRLVFPEDTDVFALSKASLSESRDVDYEYRVICKNGDIRWIRLNAEYADVDGINCAVCFFTDISAEKEKFAQLKLVAESIGSCISVMKVKGDTESLVYANDTFFRTIGVEREKYEKNISVYNLSLVTEADRKLTEAAIAKALLSGQPQELEYRLLRPGRDPIWMDRRLSAAKRGADDSYTLVSIATDITRRKKAELSAALEQRRFQLVIDEMNAAVFEWDIAIGEFYSSDSYKKYTLSEVSSKDLYENKGSVENVHPDDISALRRFFSDSKSAVSRSETTLRLKLTAGGYRWCRMVGLFYRGENGKLNRVLGVITDINEEKEKSFILDSLVNGLPGGAAIFKAAGGFECQYFNDGFAELSDRTRDELKAILDSGSFADKVVYPPDLPRYTENVNSCAAAGKNLNITFRYVTKTNEPRWVNMTANVIREEDGFPVYYCIFTTPPDEAALYRSITEDSAIGIIVSDVESHEVCYTNRAFRNMMRIENDNPCGSPCYQYVRGESAPCVNCAAKRLKPGETFTTIHHFERPGIYLKVRSSLIQWAGHTALLEYNIDITEEYKEQIRRQELINLVPAGIGYHEIVNGCVQPGYLNDGFYNLIGDSRKHRLEEMDDDVLRFTNPRDVGKLRDAAARITAGSDSESVPHRIMCGDGKYRWFQLNLSVARREGDRITVYSSYTDCDETVRARMAQEKANAALQRRYREEQRQREMLEEASAAIYKFNFTRDRLLETVKTQELFSYYKPGMSAGEFAERLRPRLPSEADRLAADEFYDCCAALSSFERGDTERSVVFRVRQNDGCVHHLKHVCNMTRDESGDVCAYVFINDISKEAENELANQSVIDDETDFILLANTVTGMARLIRLNPERSFSARRAGEEFPYEQMLSGKDIRSIVADDYEKIAEFLNLRRLDGQLRAEQTAAVSFLRTSKDGTPRRKKLSAMYLDEFRESIVLVGKDITESYEEQRRVERGLQAASKAKEEFLSRVSHDMRTPLNAVLGFTRLLKDEKGLSPAASDYLKNIDDSGSYLLGLINDVLDMSKIEEGRLRLNPEPYYYREFEKTIRTLLVPRAEEKGVELYMRCDIPETKTVYFDRLRLQQIFVNLVGNAIKFTPSGGKVEFLIASEPVTEDNRMPLTFTVRDNGIGMSEDFVKNRLYHPFEQERVFGGQTETGTGLGLSIVKKLVGQMGGTIECESKPGEGTVFTVRLYPETGGEYTEAANLPEIAESKLNGARVLLCEDNRLNTLIAEKLLEKAGYIVDTAENGAIGVEKFTSSPPGTYDAVLMDIRMPVMDGIAAAKAIRATDRADCKDVPIIAMSANAFDEDVAASLDAGMNEHLAKPTEPRKLYDALSKLIRRR